MRWYFVLSFVTSLLCGGHARINETQPASSEFTISGAPCLSPCHGECTVLMPMEYPAAAGCFDNRPSWLQEAPVPITKHFTIQNVQTRSYLSGVLGLGLGSEVNMARHGDGSWWRAEPVIQKDGYANSKQLFTLSTSASASGATQLAFSIFLTCDSSEELQSEIAPTALHLMKDIHARHLWQAVPGARNNTFRLVSSKSGSELALNGSVLSCMPPARGDLWRFQALPKSKDAHLKKMVGVDSEMCGPSEAAIGTTLQKRSCVGGSAWGNSCQFWATQWPTLGPFPWLLSPRWLLRWSVREEQMQWQLHNKEVLQEQENHPSFHVKPFFPLPYGRRAWCFTKNGGWDFCLPPNAEIYPGWSPTCSGGKPCLVWPTQGQWSQIWYSQPQNYSGCARPADAVRGWRTEATSLTDTRPFCLCKEGPRHCEDTCSGHPCPFASGCVAGKCVGPCAKGFGGIECSQKLQGQLTCHEKMALGMDDDALDLLVTMFYYPKLVAVFLLLLVAPFLMDLYQSGGFEKARAVGESSMYLHQFCPCFLSIPCCLPQINLGISNGLYCFGVCCCQTLSAVLGVLVCATVVLGATLVGPLLVYLEIKHMNRAIAFCVSGTGFTYVMLCAAIPLAFLAYIFYNIQQKLLTTRVGKWMNTSIAMKVITVGIACGSDLFACITLSPAAASLAFHLFPWLTLGRLTVLIFMVSCVFCITTVAFALLKGQVPTDIAGQEEFRGHWIGHAAVMVLIVNSIGNDLPSLFVPLMSGYLGSAEAAVTEFSIYSFAYSFISWGYTLTTFCSSSKPQPKPYSSLSTAEKPTDVDVLTHLAPDDLRSTPVDTSIERLDPELATELDEKKELPWTDEEGMKKARKLLWLELALVWVGSVAGFATAYFSSLCTPDKQIYMPGWTALFYGLVFFVIMMYIDNECMSLARNNESQAAIEWSKGFHPRNFGPRAGQVMEKVDTISDAFFAGTTFRNLHCLGQRISEIWYITMEHSTVNSIHTGTHLSYNFVILAVAALVLPMFVQLAFVLLACLPSSKTPRPGTNEEQHFEFYNLLGLQMTPSATLTYLGQACGARMIVDLVSRSDEQSVQTKSIKDPNNFLYSLVLFMFRQAQILVAQVALENTFQLNIQLSTLGIKRFIDGGAFLHSGSVMSMCIGLLTGFLQLIQLYSNAMRMYRNVRGAISRDDPHYGKFCIVSAIWWVAFVAGFLGLAYAACKLFAVFACKDSMWNINGCVDLSRAAISSGAWA